ncbi:MAG: 50S ribosomal protein L29 [Ornithinimicrobium sp.]
MAIGSKDLTTEQLRGLESDPLRDALTEAKKELFNLRFQSATGQLESHGRLRAVRRDIARIYTEMRERELGIGQAPAISTAEAEPQDATAEDADDADTDSTKEKVSQA